VAGSMVFSPWLLLMMYYFFTMYRDHRWIFSSSSYRSLGGCRALISMQINPLSILEVLMSYPSFWSCRILAFWKAFFPFRYLGIPLSPHRLLASQFSPLLHKLESAIQGWMGKHLSYGRRLEPLQTVIHGMVQF
jgi:hypothetical protein